MRSYFVILFLFTAAAGHAQTLTQPYHEPVVGDVDRNYRLDTSAYTNGLPTNITGNNVVWDFTLLAGAFPMIIDSFIAPSAASGNTNYPAATFVQHRDIVYSFFKSTTSPQQTELLGAWSPTLSLTFTNSALVVTYPVSYGYNMTDPVSGTFKYANTNGACNGSITVMADGIGTLKFPGNVSFQNVLRLRSIEQLTASVGIFPVGNIDQFIYSYYAPGKKYPVLTIQYQKYQLLAGQPTITAQAYGNYSFFPVAGMEDASTDDLPLIWPNPFSDELHVSASPDDGETEVRVFALDGKQVMFSRGQKTIPAANLSPGVYILSISNRHGTWYRKVMRE
jgi:hypothetical protein